MRRSKPKTRKIGPGHYVLLGVKCGCGGELRAQSGLSAEPEYKWEVYCDKCKGCDPNGYATLQECIVETRKRVRP